MHVPCNPPASQRSARPPLAAAVIALFASVVGVANAAEFDEKVKAPQSKDAAELHSRAQVYSARAAQARLAGAEAVIRNRSLSAEKFDVEWELQRAIDFKRPIGDLSGQGIIDRGDGSYSIDFNAYPQWNDPADHLAGLIPVLDPEAFGADLTRRGMRPDDLANLRAYLAAHDVNAATAAAALPIAVSFSRVVKKFDKIKRPVPDSLVFAYIYQRERATSEARRLWAESLLDAIGPAGSRIVQSYMGEVTSTGVWAPSDPRAGIDGLLAALRLPDFEQKATAQAKGVAP